MPAFLLLLCSYMKVASGLPSKSLFNQTGAGIPDVAAQSENFAVVIVSVVLLCMACVGCCAPRLTLLLLCHQGGFPEPVDGTR